MSAEKDYAVVFSAIEYSRRLTVKKVVDFEVESPYAGKIRRYRAIDVLIKYVDDLPPRWWLTALTVRRTDNQVSSLPPIVLERGFHDIDAETVAYFDQIAEEIDPRKNNV